MKVTVIIFSSILLTSCARNKSELNSVIETLDMERVAFACDCADWVKLKDFEKANYADSAIFIDPADSSLILPDTLGYNGDIIRFTGQFYKKKGYPENYHSFELPDKARVFRYINFEVLRSNYKEAKVAR